MYIWEGDSTSSRIQLDSFTPMGRIVENNALIYTLQRRVEGEIDTFHGKVQATQGDDVMRLSLGDAQFTCSLLIGADGKESIVRKLIQPNIFGRNYNQKGLVATISTDAVKNDTAFQRFLPTGPFALLPIGEGALSMVWTLPSETVERILSLNLPKENLLLLFKAACRLLKSDVSYYLANPEVLSEEEYKWRESVLEDVHKDLNSPLPNLIDVSSTSLAAFPLSLSIAQKTVAERTIIIGDAAHVFHPLAGQGVDLGIADVRDLCDTISEAASVGADLGDVDSYKFYEKRRLASTMTMAGFCDATHRVFDPSFPVPKLRTLGMKCVEMSPLIKNFVMQAAQL